MRHHLKTFAYLVPTPDHQASLKQLHSTREEVDRHVNQFKEPKLSFASDPTAMDDPCPSLDYSRNESFLRHKQRLEVSLERAETVAIYGDSELRSLRKAVVDIIQANLEHLDGLPEKQWCLLKTEKFQETGAEVILDAGVDESKF